MANGIGRLRLKGISLQPNFGTASTSPGFFIPADEAFLIEPVLNKAENDAAMGSGYEVVDMQNTTRFSQFPLGHKVDEDLYPLFFLQKYSISTTDNGDSTHTHELFYKNTTQNWFTVFMQDDQRTDYRMKDVLFNGLNTAVEAGTHLTLNGQGVGHYLESGGYTVTAVDPDVFTGGDVNMYAGDFGGALAEQAVETLTANHSFSLSGEDRNFDLGNNDLAFHEIAEDRYEFEFTSKMVDRDEYDIFTANTERVYTVSVTDTGRTIGTASQNPTIVLEYPIGKPMSFTPEGDLNTHLTFNASYLANARKSVTDSPLKITVINSTPSYTT